MSCCAAEKCAKEPVPLPLAAPVGHRCYEVSFEGRRLLRFSVPAPLNEGEALTFALTILEFLGLDVIPGLHLADATYCPTTEALDELLGGKIPCYSIAALLRDQAAHTLALDGIVAHLAALSPQVNRV